jgi:hypothetical protein
LTIFDFKIRTGASDEGRASNFLLHPSSYWHGAFRRSARRSDQPLDNRELAKVEAGGNASGLVEVEVLD